MTKITTALFDRLQKLYTGLISDVLDDHFGFQNNHYIMGYEVRPLYPGAVLIGRAATAMAAAVYSEPKHPYQREIEFVDGLKAGDVAVMTQSGAMTAGLWGGLLSTGAKQRGARGAVIDGLTRDTQEIIRLNFPVFIKGIAPGDTKGRLEIIDCNVPIKCAGALVSPGDVIIGDNDGVVVIPQDVAVDVVRLAEEKYHKEMQFKRGLENGASVADMFKQHGVL